MRRYDAFREPGAVGPRSCSSQSGDHLEVTQHPTPTDQALARAANLKAEARLAEAAAVLSDALRSDLTAHALSHQLALIESERGNWSEAEHFARTAASSGGDAYAGSLGQILTRVGKYDEAQIWLRRALAVDSSDADALACLGFVYYGQRKLDEALSCFDQALLLCPDFPSAQRYRNQIFLEQSLFARVRALLAESAKVNGPRSVPDASESGEVEIPSASLDASGHPRFTMRLPVSLIVNDLGAANLFYHEVAGRGFEFGLRRFLDLHLLSDDVFIDVGAHWGIHSLTAATRRPREISVLAIEAHPENSARLRQWVERNQLGADIEVISKAVGDRRGAGSMWVSGSSMGHSLRTDGRDGGSKAIDVEIITLDQLMADRRHLHWRRIILKVDVEGCELEALAGARELFSTAEVAAVIWEKSAFHEPAAQDQRNNALFDFLNTRGFEHFHMEDENLGGRLIPVERKNLLCNVFSLAPNFDRRERYS